MTKTRPASKASAPSARGAASAAARAETQRTERRRRTTMWTVGTAVAAVLVAVLYTVFNTASSSATKAGGYQVGTPGIGATAPGFNLAASTGKNINLADYKGKTVLLYFQEGLTCQPCWDQMTDLEKNAAQVKAAGIDQVVSITSDPANLIARKTTDMKLATPVLSDPHLAVSQQYHANSFGMMGSSRDGHTFVLVGPDGTIKWRADYGGAPKYTMYVAPTKLLADLKAGEAK